MRKISLIVCQDKSYPKEGLWIAYCPELDLYGYDYGKGAAIKSFGVVLHDYFDYVSINGTLEGDLRTLL